ncbi:MAG: hypothetical protein RLZZ571_1253 [Actinomycetota bacterium]
MTEQLRYTLLKRFANFELRHYPDFVLVQIESDGDFARAGSSAFNPLVRYISGANLSQKKISMTAPVIQETIAPQRHLVSFVLPESLEIDQIPVPSNGKLTTKLVKAHDVAALKFSGGWSQKSFESKTEELLKALRNENIQTVGSFYVARFDPPWKPSFLRHNEVLIDLAHPFK